KAGYKQTDVGVIPEDWEIKKLGDVLKVKHGKSQKEVENINGQYPILGTGGLMGYTNHFLYDKESVLIGRKGTIDKPRFMNSPFWTVDTLFYTEIFNKYFPKYLYYKFLQIDWYSYNEASVVPSLNAKTIENIEIAIPSTKAEQAAIATALSDTDPLISSLEKLIVKKRNIKQGAMQTLLQSKEGWEVKKLGDISEVKSGKRLPLGKQLTEIITPHPYIRILDMSDNGISLTDIKYVPEDVFPIIKNYRIFKGDIYISVAGTLGLVGRVPDILNGANLTENANKITDIKCNTSYLLCVLRSDFIQNKIEAERTMGAQPKLALTRIRNFEIPLPSPEEQTQIAKILSDMDTEITALETKLAKIKAIKQGMMQNLLTGKIRLIINN
ncbi:MAG: restriction endonuclease subunit S, partial [Methylococcales bacterium]|nr:restriction endonuclease subunit S [Methylococcales bacterium]